MAQTFDFPCLECGNFIEEIPKDSCAATCPFCGAVFKVTNVYFLTRQSEETEEEK